MEPLWAERPAVALPRSGPGSTCQPQVPAAQEAMGAQQPPPKRKGVTRHLAEAEVVLKKKLAELQAALAERERLENRFQFVSTVLPSVEWRLRAVSLASNNAPSQAGGDPQGAVSPSPPQPEEQLGSGGAAAAGMDTAVSGDFSELMAMMADDDDEDGPDPLLAGLAGMSPSPHSRDETRALERGSSSVTQSSHTSTPAPASEEETRLMLRQQWALMVQSLSRSLVSVTVHPDRAASEADAIR